MSPRRLFDEFKAWAIPRVDRHPRLAVKLRSLAHQKRILQNLKLQCISPGHSCFEVVSELGMGRGELEARSLFTCLNTGTERALFLGLPNTRSDFPYTPMASGVGIVERSSRSLRGAFRKGDLVAGPFFHSSHRVFQPDQVVKVDKKLPLEEAAHLHLAIIAMQGLRMGRLSEKDRVMVMGQGVIGRLATLLARSFGAEVWAMSRTQNTLDRFKESRGLSLESQDHLEKLKRIRPTLVIEATGDPKALLMASELVSEKARIVILGSTRAIYEALRFDGAFAEKQLEIIGAHIRNIQELAQQGAPSYQQEGQRIQDLILSGRLSLTEVSEISIGCKDLPSSYPAFFIRDKQDALAANHPCSGALIDWRQSQEVLRTLKAMKARFAEPTFDSALKPLSIALVGCGDIAGANAKAISESKAFYLQAVLDTDKKKSDAYSRRYQVTAHQSYESLLQDPSIDCVFLAIPHHLHHPFTLQALEARKHVLVEKPMAISVAQAKEMRLMAQQRQRALSTFFPFEFEAKVQRAKQLVDAGILGELHGASMEFHRDRPRHYWFVDGQMSWRGSLTEAGGGFLTMYLVHALNSLQKISNLEVEAVMASLATQSHPIEVEDAVALLFRGTRGELGTLSGSSAVRGQGGSHTRIWGEHGQILIDDHGLRFFSRRPYYEYSSLRWHHWDLRKEERRRDPRVLFLRHFRQQLECQDMSSFSDDGYRSMALVDAAYRSNRSVKWESLQL